MTITLALSFLLSSASALSADCSSENWGKPNMSTFWNAREVSCKGSGTFGDDSISISYTGNTPSTQLCWFATENILNQCIANAWQLGYYNWAGTSYKVVRKKVWRKVRVTTIL